MQALRFTNAHSTIALRFICDRCPVISACVSRYYPLDHNCFPCHMVLVLSNTPCSTTPPYSVRYRWHVTRRDLLLVPCCMWQLPPPADCQICDAATTWYLCPKPQWLWDKWATCLGAHCAPSVCKPLENSGNGQRSRVFKLAICITLCKLYFGREKPAFEKGEF